ncbi:MAG: hypothetical protein HQL34_09960 [Alphaproteobacteria bacterium]|nr:hypothetical protein [Alphaproteobacteria bacterium]
MTPSNITAQTLLEQMRIADREIEVRKRLFDFTDADVANLTACKDVIAANLDAIVEEFYAFQIAQPEVSLVIGDKETSGSIRAT